MEELIQVGKQTYYIKNATNIGIYKENDKDIWLIDSGNDKEAGKKILKKIAEYNFNVLGIINTHSNADHMGGNKVIQERTNCKIMSKGIENSIMKDTILEPTLLYGGYPFKDITNKFMMAKSVNNVLEIEDNLPSGLEYIDIPGHYFDMIGIKTPDNIYFLGDSLFGEETIKKYQIFYIYDVKKYLETLKFLETLEGSLYIPSHVEPLKDIKKLININRTCIENITREIMSICKENIIFEDLLKKIFDKYKINMTSEQYILIGSTIKSYLSYLYNEDKIKIEFIDNKMYWQTK